MKERTVAELRKELSARGLVVPRGARKQDMVDMLAAAPSMPAPAAATAAAPAQPQTSARTVTELKQELTRRGVAFAPKAVKAQLIALLESLSSSSSSTAEAATQPQSNSAPAAASKAEEAGDADTLNIDAMRVSDLRAALARRGLPTAGVKSALRDRLAASLDAPAVVLPTTVSSLLAGQSPAPKPRAPAAAVRRPARRPAAKAAASPPVRSLFSAAPALLTTDVDDAPVTAKPAAAAAADAKAAAPVRARGTKRASGEAAAVPRKQRREQREEEAAAVAQPDALAQSKAVEAPEAADVQMIDAPRNDDAVAGVPAPQPARKPAEQPARKPAEQPAAQPQPLPSPPPQKAAPPQAPEPPTPQPPPPAPPPAAAAAATAAPARAETIDLTGDDADAAPAPQRPGARRPSLPGSQRRASFSGVVEEFAPAAADDDAVATAAAAEERSGAASFATADEAPSESAAQEAVYRELETALLNATLGGITRDEFRVLDSLLASFAEPPPRTPAPPVDAPSFLQASFMQAPAPTPAWRMGSEAPTPIRPAAAASSWSARGPSSTARLAPSARFVSRPPVPAPPLPAQAGAPWFSPPAPAARKPSEVVERIYRALRDDAASPLPSAIKPARETKWEQSSLLEKSFVFSPVEPSPVKKQLASRLLGEADAMRFRFDGR